MMLLTADRLVLCPLIRHKHQLKFSLQSGHIIVFLLHGLPSIEKVYIKIKLLLYSNSVKTEKNHMIQIYWELGFWGLESHIRSRGRCGSKLEGFCPSGYFTITPVSGSLNFFMSSNLTGCPYSNRFLKNFLCIVF